LVYHSTLLFPNSYTITSWEFYFLPFSVHAQTTTICLNLLSVLKWGFNCLYASSRGLNNLNKLLYRASLKIYNKFTDYFCVIKCIVRGNQARVKNADLRHPSCTVVMYKHKSASPVHNALTHFGPTGIFFLYIYHKSLIQSKVTFF
jgi:hypothetical protein